jgi:hypothetical protein
MSGDVVYCVLLEVSLEVTKPLAAAIIPWLQPRLATVPTAYNANIAFVPEKGVGSS